MKIKLAHKVFKTKESAKKYIKYILYYTKTDYLEGEALEVVDSLLKRHHRYEDKVGNGSYKIGIEPCPFQPKNNRFFIEREDGSVDDFSFYKCLSPRSLESEVKCVLRDAIQGQAREYKDNYFEQNADNGGYVKCDQTSLKVKKNEAHLDHYPKQFDEIVFSWLKKNKLKLEDFKVKPSKVCGESWKAEDKKLLADFIQYHQEQAKYRVVLAKVNLQRGRGSQPKLIDLK